MPISTKLAPYQPTPWPQNPRAVPDYGRVEVRSVACDPRTDRVFVVQYSAKYPVLVFNRAGRFLTSWGAGQFTMPHGCRICPRTGELWMTDDGDSRVLHFSQTGALLATYGVKNKPGNDRSHFNRPADVAFAPDGSVFVADGYGNARVVHLDAHGRFLNAWGTHGTGKGQFHLVHSVAVDNSRIVYVADRENARIQLFTSQGKWLMQWSQVGHPFGLAWTPEQNLVVCDGAEDTVSVYDRAGRRLSRFGGTGSAPGNFRRAHLCEVDQTNGALYVAEVKGRRVQKFLPAR